MAVPDNGPVLAGVTWFLTVLCGIFLALRLYAKLSRQQRLWWDDYILITSWVLLLAEATLTQVGAALGFGKRIVDIPVPNLATIFIGISVATTISCFASTLSKISFGITLLRLTTHRTKLFVWFCIITLFLVMIPSAMLSWVQCVPLTKVWDASIKGMCLNKNAVISYGIFNASWCAAADFALALLPWKLVWGLQLKRREKMGVGIAMSIGVLSGVCAIVKGIYLVQLRSQDFSYNGKDLTIWTAVETATAIIAASIPVLRVFFKEKVTSYGASRGASNNHSSARGGAKAVPLSRLNRSQQSRTTTTIEATRHEGKWNTLDPTEDSDEDGASQRRIVVDEKDGTSKSVGRDGILQTNTVTVTVADDSGSHHRARSWLGM